MLDRGTFIILNSESHYFWSGHRWVREYPDAEIYKNYRRAVRVAERLSGATLNACGENVIPLAVAAERRRGRRMFSVKQEFEQNLNPLNNLLNVG